ncbi:MAG: hypothetical protein IJR60_01725 [Eubacterium sp.]|nr:hypothetical protein [Eubacterium sp.]
MKKKLSISLICVFLAVIVFFTSFSVFGKKKDFSVDENRALMTMPEIALDSVLDGSFQQDYSDYLSDQFEWRSTFVNIKTNIMLALGKKEINGVYIGKNDYFMEKFSDADFDEDVLEYNEKNMNYFLRYASEDYEINTVCAFVPSKSDVLKKNLPNNLIPYDASYAIEDTLDGADSVKTPDLYKALQQHDDEYIFYKTDHHWTSLGAYYAYCEIADSLGVEPVSIDNFKSLDVATDFYGSTFDKVQVRKSPDTITKYDTGVKVKVDYNGEQKNTTTLYADKMLKEKSKYDYFLGGNFARIDITTDCKNGKTLLLMKDSFANSLVPFLCCNYSHIIMVDVRYFDDDVYALFETEDIDDLLVLYNTEQYMKAENMDVLEPEESEDDAELDEDDAFVLEAEENE